MLRTKLSACAIFMALFSGACNQGDGQRCNPLEYSNSGTAGDCADLRVSWEGYSGPDRFGPTDQGWRWSYSKYSTRRYRVTVYPDAMLNRTNPQFASDETGRTTVTRAGDPPVEFAPPR